jgi:hypothetical protein
MSFMFKNLSELWISKTRKRVTNPAIRRRSGIVQDQSTRQTLFCPAYLWIWRRVSFKVLRPNFCVHFSFPICTLHVPIYVGQYKNTDVLDAVSPDRSAQWGIFPTAHRQRCAVKSLPTWVLWGNTVPWRFSFMPVNRISLRGLRVTWPLGSLDSRLQPRGRHAVVCNVCCVQFIKN